MDKIKLAIIGSGHMAEEHLKVFSQLEEFSLSGIYSRTRANAEHLASKFNINYIADSIEHLYTSTKPDVVLVAVTESSFHSIVSQLLEFEWTIFSEKPIGLGYNEFFSIKELIKKKDRNVIIAMNRRHYDSTLVVKQDLHHIDGKRLITVTDHQDLESYKKIGFDETTIKYWMYKNSLHLVDYFYTFARSNISEVKSSQSWSEGTFSPVIAHIKYENGDEGIYNGVWHGPGPWAVSITHPSKYAIMSPLELAQYRNCSSYKTYEYDLPESGDHFKPGLLKQAEQLVKYLKGEVNSAVTLDIYEKTATLLHRIYGV